MKKILYFTGMILGIIVAGAVFGIIAAFILAWLLQDSYNGWGGLVGLITGLAIGYPVGVFIGLVIFKKYLHYPGSLLLGLIGVIAGGILPFVLAEPTGLNQNTTLLWAVILFSSPLLGTIGFHLRGRGRNVLEG